MRTIFWRRSKPVASIQPFPWCVLLFWLQTGDSNTAHQTLWAKWDAEVFNQTPLREHKPEESRPNNKSRSQAGLLQLWLMITLITLFIPRFCLIPYCFWSSAILWDNNPIIPFLGLWQEQTWQLHSKGAPSWMAALWNVRENWTPLVLLCKLQTASAYPFANTSKQARSGVETFRKTCTAFPDLQIPASSRARTQSWRSHPSSHLVPQVVAQAGELMLE